MEVDLKVLLASSELSLNLTCAFLKLTVFVSRPLHEKITKAEVEAVIDSYKRMKWWP